MNAALLYGTTAAILIGIGFYGLAAHRDLLRQIVAFNVVGSGVFLLFGALSRRSAGEISDPVPAAMIITGIVVALSATALAVALVTRLRDETERSELPETEDGDG